jgi:hypothetical protein
MGCKCSKSRIEKTGVDDGPLGITRHTWEESIKMDKLKQTCDIVKMTQLAQRQRQ